MIAIVLSAALAVATAAAAPGSLDEAIDLYHAARFAEALEMLDSLEVADDGSAGAEATLGPITEYRALCLLALDREADARAAVEKFIAVHPAYRPQSDVPPRLASLIGQVRAALLPDIVRAEYRLGKASFDRQAYSEARERFGQVLALLDGAGEDQPANEQLADMRDLAAGFLDVIGEAAPPAASVPPGVPPVPASNAAPAAPAAPAEAEVYTAADQKVLPPVAVRQDFPNWRNVAGDERWVEGRTGLKGLLEVTIDAKGQVEKAELRTRVHPLYDSRLLEATRAWQYRPATRDGAAVRYRKLIAIELTVRSARMP